ncbi:tunicamycin resistance protein [Scheffersomyces stipitis CBS 6054]|uniref:UDP-N-acetylglucosamine--dolichyl-phosphate N-acetylglucosaminephosphotransferase n=1 Tax=Scheffersomyces stipitis (strain ATCC 58785 / CBS 6054 / NBRC 10063 / NRRL Y-11545) TaxID=322104 RepID=A3LVW8_PICST|nr:tunicamycin resistance protein [Scheffersomyces stipitis CBS 6054]ABN67188.2 tunicamycin resistance protein [Scheffersomyces stipitis CBS 6054]
MFRSRLFRLSVLVASVALITPNNPLQASVAFAGIGYVVTVSLIPRVAPSFIRIGLKGRDLSKPPPVDYIAESMGIVSAVTYLFLMFGLIPFVFFKYLVLFTSLSNDSSISDNYKAQYQSISNVRLFPHNKLAEYLSAILCLQSTTLLGFLDDLFDIRWRHKFFLPAVASLPLLIVYYVDFSVTSIVVPTFVTDLPGGDLLIYVLNSVIRIGNHFVTKVTGLSFSTLAADYEVPKATPKLIDLGVFYYGYMSAVSIFSPNSINILAGINGLEVGQSIVLGLIVLVNDACYLLSDNISGEAYDFHLFSVIFIVPFMGVSLGLLSFNWYPSKVFVGDTYCYFSGMVFAIVAILGHFSKTLLLFLLPQILNFVYSVPQLFGIVPCPRHRLPKFNKDSGLMTPSYGELKHKAFVGVAMLTVLEKFRLIHLKRDAETNEIKEFSNMTLINLFLVWFGPLREDTLCVVILMVQLTIGIAMIFVRHTVGPWMFGYDNLSWGVK